MLSHVPKLMLSYGPKLMLSYVPPGGSATSRRYSEVNSSGARSGFVNERRKRFPFWGGRVEIFSDLSIILAPPPATRCGGLEVSR